MRGYLAAEPTARPALNGLSPLVEYSVPSVCLALSPRVRFPLEVPVQTPLAIGGTCPALTGVH